MVRAIHYWLDIMIQQMRRTGMCVLKANTSRSGWCVEIHVWKGRVFFVEFEIGEFCGWYVKATSAMKLFLHEPNLQNQAYPTKYTEPNMMNQIHQTLITKPNSQKKKI